VGRGGRGVWLGTLRWPIGRDHWYDDLWRIGTGERGDEEVRIHQRTCYCHRQGSFGAKQIRRHSMQPAGVLGTPEAINPLKDLLKFAQSIWLDYIRRDLISSGELQRLIEEDGLRGMTSNPAIFEKAIAGSTDYADILASLRERTDLDAKARYEILAIR